MNRSPSPRRPACGAGLHWRRLGIAALFGLLGVPGLAAAAESPAALLQRAEAQVRIDPALSARLALQALEMLGEQGPADARVQALMLLCEHEGERDRAQARRRLEAARGLMPQVQRRGLQARVYGCEGELQQLAGDGAAALRLFEQAVLAAEQADDRMELAQALYHRGFLRGVRGDYATGLTDLKRAATLYDALEMPAHRTTVHIGIAVVYNRMGDAEQARSFYESALRDQQAAGLKRELVVTWHNLARVHEHLRDWPAAEEAFSQSLALARELDYGRGVSYSLRGLATVANARGKPALALAQLEQAERLQRAAPDERLEGQIALQRGIALRLTGRPVEAQAALSSALAVFERAESPNERAAAHEEMARLLSEQGHWREAYGHLAAFKALSDQTLRRQIDDRFATLKAEVDRSAEAQQVRLLQREQVATQVALAQERLSGRLRNATIALGAAGALVLAGLAWYLRRHGQAMKQLALTDELTGLPNRRDVLQKLDQMLARRQPCALLIVDLDHFKRINDTHGHPAGDGVLRAAAAVLQDIGRAPVALGRLGGEEFVLVLPQAGAAAAAALAERVRLAIEALDVRSLVPGGHITTSVGTTVAAIGDHSSDLLRRADRALYLAKARGRNRVETILPEDELSAGPPPAAMPPDRSPPLSSDPIPRPAA